MGEEALEYFIGKPFGTDTMRMLLKRDIFIKGKDYKRANILEAVQKKFEEIGGGKVRIRKIAAAFNKVTRQENSPLQSIEGTNGGYKFIGYPDANPRTVQEPESDTAPKAAIDVPEDTIGEPEVTVGSGHYQVYAWALPLYLQHPVDGRLPVKVGRTEKSLAQRLSGSSVDLPEVPRPLLAVYFDSDADARKMEQTFQFILEQRGRMVTSAIGTEWFWTNKEELLEIVEIIKGTS